MPQVVLTGLDDMIKAMERQTKAVTEASRAALIEAAYEVQSAAHTLLSLTSHAPNTPTPSAPGTPPSLITGHLHSSVFVEEPTSEGPVASVKIGPTAVYARIQELGGTTGKGYRTHLPPRPYLKPAVALASDGVRSALSDAWLEALAA